MNGQRNGPIHADNHAVLRSMFRWFLFSHSHDHYRPGTVHTVSEYPLSVHKMPATYKYKILIIERHNLQMYNTTTWNTYSQSLLWIDKLFIFVWSLHRWEQKRFEKGCHLVYPSIGSNERKVERIKLWFVCRWLTVNFDCDVEFVMISFGNRKRKTLFRWMEQISMIQFSVPRKLPYSIEIPTSGLAIWNREKYYATREYSSRYDSFFLSIQCATDSGLKLVALAIFCTARLRTSIHCAIHIHKHGNISLQCNDQTFLGLHFHKCSRYGN